MGSGWRRWDLRGGVGQAAHVPRHCGAERPDEPLWRAAGDTRFPAAYANAAAMGVRELAESRVGVGAGSATGFGAAMTSPSGASHRLRKWTEIEQQKRQPSRDVSAS